MKNSLLVFVNVEGQEALHDIIMVLRDISAPVVPKHVSYARNPRQPQQKTLAFSIEALLVEGDFVPKATRYPISL